MRLETPGKSISEVEIINIDLHGIWLFANDKEYFLPFAEFPWFREAKVVDIMNVRLLHGFHLHWPSLDIDLDLDTLENTSKTPLVYR